MAEQAEKFQSFQGDYPQEGNFQAERSSVSTSPTERARWPPLTRMLMSGEMNGEPPRNLTAKEKFDVWMVNEGHRRLFVGVFAIAHLMVFGFAFLNFHLKDSLSGPRATFGMTFVIARAAALVLHFDIALLLLRM